MGPFWSFSILVVFHFSHLPFWSSSILVVFHFGRLRFWSSSILVVFDFGRLPFWSSSILVVFHFGRLPFWSSSILVVFHFGLHPFSCNFLSHFNSKTRFDVFTVHSHAVYVRFVTSTLELKRKKIRTFYNNFVQKLRTCKNAENVKT